MPPGPLKMKEKTPPADMSTNTVKPNQAFLLLRASITYMIASPVPLRVERCLICRHSCSKYTRWPSATATSTSAVQTCLLVECCCKMEALNPACPLVWWFYICLFYFYFWLKPKCLQLDFNFIANNLRKKMGLRHISISISHNVFTYSWPPSWTQS